jgi:hypothetical protein
MFGNAFGVDFHPTAPATAVRYRKPETTETVVQKLASQSASTGSPSATGFSRWFADTKPPLSFHPIGPAGFSLLLDPSASAAGPPAKAAE